MNKITLALAALGVVSLASVAQANTIVYLTGSTAARSTIYAAATNSVNGIFTGGGTVVSPGGTSSSSQIVYEGTISGVSGTVDLDCSFSGSEAGIGAVAGVPVSQTLTSLDPNVPSGTTESFPLPNANPAFLQSPAWTSAATLPTGTYPDLSMADTSQAVSRTPNSGSTALTDYGIVGVIPFTWLKGYESTPDATWNNLSNVTTAELNQLFSAGDLLDANLFTGVSSDSADGVGIIGRNLGSGTRVNTLLNSAQYGVTTAVQQYAYGTPQQLYPSTTPGTLTFSGVYTQQTLTAVGNDGFDSGGGVQEELNTDGTGNFVVPIGYVGMSDAKNALNFVPGTTGGGVATPLTFNGVYESDSAVINGDYTFWGSEHLLGSHGQSASSVAGETATAIVKGLAGTLSRIGAGTVTGNIVSNHAQSAVIPTALMQVGRGNLDSGFPSQGTF